MKVVCAYCGKNITERAGCGDCISHGICDFCMDIELKKLDELKKKTDIWK